MKILSLLAENPDKEFTLYEIVKIISGDRSNTGKQVRTLAKQGKLKYIAGDRINPSLVSYLPNPTLPYPTQPTQPKKTSLHKKMNDALIEARENGLDEPITDEIKESQRIAKRAAQETVFPPTKPRKAKIPDFNTFMVKLDKSDSASSKHLKEKMNVKGKHRSINKERVFRIIRDVIDTLKE